MNEIIQAVGTLGFPVVVAIGVCYFVYIKDKWQREDIARREQEAIKREERREAEAVKRDERYCEEMHMLRDCFHSVSVRMQELIDKIETLMGNNIGGDNNE